MNLRILKVLSEIGMMFAGLSLLIFVLLLLMGSLLFVISNHENRGFLLPTKVPVVMHVVVDETAAKKNSLFVDFKVGKPISLPFSGMRKPADAIRMINDNQSEMTVENKILPVNTNLRVESKNLFICIWLAVFNLLPVLLAGAICFHFITEAIKRARNSLVITE